MWQFAVSVIVRFVPVERIAAYVLDRLVDRWVSAGPAVVSDKALARIGKAAEHLGELAAVVGNVINKAAETRVREASRDLLGMWADGDRAPLSLEREAGIAEG